MLHIKYRNLMHLIAMTTLIFCMTATTHLQAASYNTKTGELFLPSLVNGSTTWTDVTIKLKPDGTFVIQNGTESALPFRCPGVFSEATLDLIRSATSSDEIDTLLGCRWAYQQKQLIDAISSIPEQNNSTFVWQDSKCSSLEFGIGEASIIGRITTSTLTLTKADCNTAFNIRIQNHLYDLQSKLFLVVSVAIDNSAIASEVLIKFHDNKYELISFALRSQAKPPVICRSLSEADFNAVSTDMSSDEVSNILGCQWINKTLTDPQTSSSYSWRDHECNELSVGGGIKQIILRQSGGCNSFGAQ